MLQRVGLACFGLAFAVGAEACQPFGKVETIAAVAGFERTGLKSPQHRFLYCNVTIGWTSAELLTACGEPVAIYATANPGDRCYAYSTVARPMGTALQGAGKMYYLACAGEGDVTRKGKVVRDRVVTAVYAVTELPSETTPAK